MPSYKYSYLGGRIARVEITRETSAYVWVKNPDGSLNKQRKAGAYADTYTEARAALIEAARLRHERAEGALLEAQVYVTTCAKALRSAEQIVKEEPA